MIRPGDRELAELLGESSHRVVAPSLFRYLIALEVEKAQRLSYCISVICLGADIVQADRHRLSESHIFEAILRIVRATDVVTPLPDACFAVLLIDAESTALPEIIDRLREEVAAVALSGGQMTTWSAGGACYPKTTTAGPELLRDALRLMTLARGEGGDRFYVAS
jgi:hypothetical protein